jgi:hypothetical protein
MAKQQVSCYHINLRPTEWNQPKPEPWHGETCDCGTNWNCPICGWGFGAYPCECAKQRMGEAGIIGRTRKPYKKNTDPCYYCGKIGLHYCVMRGGTG